MSDSSEQEKTEKKFLALKWKFFPKKGHSENLVRESFSVPQTRRQVSAHGVTYFMDGPLARRLFRCVYVCIVSSPSDRYRKMCRLYCSL